LLAPHLDLGAGTVLLCEHRNRHRQVIAILPKFEVEIPDFPEAIETSRQARAVA
jgi:hypothetical protein